MDRILVLPLPEGPQRAVTKASVSKVAATRKPEVYWSWQENSSRGMASSATHEVLACGQRREGQDDGCRYQTPHPLLVVGARLVVEDIHLNCQRAGLGPNSCEHE